MKNDKKFVLLLISVFTFIVVMLVSLFFFFGVQSRFSKYLIQVNNSTRSDGYSYIDYQDKHYIMLEDNAYKLYSWLIVYGPGRERLFKVSNPEDQVTITYGNEAVLKLSQKDNYLYIEFNKDNYSHYFKTNEVNLDRFISEILSFEENTPEKIKDKV